MLTLFKRLIILSAVTAISCNAIARTDEWLDRLDNALDHYPEYLSQRTAQIDSIRTARYNTPFDREMALQDAYVSFSLDSAMVHTRKAEKLASTPLEKTKAQMALANMYVKSGIMYKEAFDIYETLDRECIAANDLLFPYYSLSIQLFGNLSTQSLDPELKRRYYDAKVAYRDSALMLQPDNDVLLAHRYMDNSDYASAVKVLSKNLPDGLLTREAAVKYDVLAKAYTMQGNREMARKYLIQAAICDITNGVREYRALQQLAMMLYDDGDYDRAHKYIHQSINDATACNAKLRMLEMSEMLPIIDSAHELSKMRVRKMLYVLLGLISLLAIALIYALYAMHRKNKSLAQAYKEQQNLNESLHASDRIKEEYIKRFMNLSLEYLAQMESYRSNLLRVAGHRDFESLRDAIKSNKYIEEGIKNFYIQFDKAFLNLFPTFIPDLKALMTPDYVFNIKKDEKLNTELRIVALMRLGIDDGDSICRFLRCSASTVYNYRTRLRNAAINRESFFTDILNIGRTTQPKPEQTPK